MKKVLIILIAAMLFSLPANAAASLVGMPDNTPPENIFVIDGYSDNYLLMDLNDRDKSGYLVMMIDFCGSVLFDSGNTAKFDETNAKNIAYRLNNEFANAQIVQKIITGFVNVESVDYLTKGLSHVVRPHINFEHVWTDGESEVTAGIVLPSEAELVKYRSILGRKDKIWNNGALGWFLRTPARTAGRVLCVRTDNDSLYGTEVTENAANRSLAIRPMFWVDKDFFAKVKLSYAGENVTKHIKSIYGRDELMPLYTERELVGLLGYKAEVTLHDAKITGDAVTVAAANYGEAKRLILAAVLYNRDNMPVAYRLQDFEARGGEGKEITVNFDSGELIGTKGHVSLFVWGASESHAKVSNTLVLKN